MVHINVCGPMPPGKRSCEIAMLLSPHGKAKEKPSAGQSTGGGLFLPKAIDHEGASAPRIH
jgi:hypothetical protein